ncbi:MAG: 30S ribosomal protein S7 [Candidatus Geothermincolia bacterium]
MARKGASPKREAHPDPLYHNALVTQFVNKIMLDGKKSTSQKVVYGALDIISRRTGNDPLAVMRKAMDNVRPLLEVRSRRVGGASYQVPVEVQPRRSNTLAIRWIVANTRNRNEKSMRERFANELMDAAAGAGASVKKREDLYKMAEANKAFSHYRW